jgi:ankyrin repeat protein
MDGWKLLKNAMRNGILLGSCLWAPIVWAESSSEDDSLINKFYYALIDLDEKTARDCIAQGFDPNTKDGAGRTCLYACTHSYMFPHVRSENQPKVIQLAIECGSDVNVRTNTGATPLLIALLSRRLPVVQILLDNGANTHDHALFMMLMEIRSSKGLAIAQLYLDLLLKYGADINEPDPLGDTPLLKALNCPFYSFLDLIQLFLSRGANVNAVNHKGEMPLGIVIKRKAKALAEIKKDPDLAKKLEDQYDQIIELLREHGAVESQPRDKMEGQSHEEHTVTEEAEDGSAESSAIQKCGSQYTGWAFYAIGRNGVASAQ